jgi:sugar O-acyltransferase (sialic acid O-acetyltransferase NeuD family)
VSGERLLIFGAGGHGKVVADVGRSAGLVPAAFIDDLVGRDGASFWGLPVIHWERLLRERELWQDARVALGIGDNGARKACLERVLGAGLGLATLVHARAVIAPSASLGIGSVAMANAVVNPDAVVGQGAILNTGSVVEHDCRLGDFVHLSPNVALGGAAQLGDRTHIGLGAVVLPGVVIGAGVVVGAGAVVTRGVPDGLTVAGVPAQPIRKSTERGRS